MLKKIRGYFLVLLAVVLLMTSCIGCGKKVVKKDENTILLWSTLSPDQNEIIQQIANKWGSENGKKIKVNTSPNTAPENFDEMLNVETCPDIVLGFYSDQVWTYDKIGMIDYMPSELIDKTMYNKNALKSVQMGNKIIGIPIYMETSTLIYNTEKVSTPPSTIDDFLNEAKKVGFSYDINNFYFNYAFFSGNGAYIFKENDEGYDTKDIGLGDSCAAKGFKIIQSFVNEYNFMGPTISRKEAFDKFKAKESGLYIGTPQSATELKDANIKISTTTIPKINGKTPSSLISTTVGIVNSKSRQKSKSWELLKYISENLNDDFYQKSYLVPVLNSQIKRLSESNDPILSGFIQQTLQSEPIPNVKEMSVVWNILTDETELIASNKITPEDAAEKTKSVIEDLIEFNFKN